MSDIIELEIVTSTGIGEKTEITEVYFPSSGKGETGVLYNHLPYVSMVEPGEMNYLDKDGKRHYYFIEDGFIETKDNRIVVISDSLIKAEDMKKEEIEGELAEINKSIAEASEGKYDADELTGFLKKQHIAELKLEIKSKS